MSSDSHTVYVSSAVTPAQGEPQFVIEHDGTLYLTVAVLAYGKGDAEAERLRGALASGEPVKAARYAQAKMVKFANTDPPPED